MKSPSFLVCPKRPGNPRVALQVCRACDKAPRCPAWQLYQCPPLFPEAFSKPDKAKGK